MKGSRTQSSLVAIFLKSLMQKLFLFVIVLAFLLICNASLTSAASGGRMGGSFFPSSSSSKSESESSSLSSSSEKSSSSSWSSSRSRSSDVDVWNIMAYDSDSDSDSISWSYSTGSSRRGSRVYPTITRHRGPTIPWSGEKVVYSDQNNVAQPSDNEVKSESGNYTFVWIVAGAVIVLGIIGTCGNKVSGNAKGTRVIKIQVGLPDSARFIQKELNKIAETADTSSPKGVANLLRESILSLLRHQDFCVSCYSSVDIKYSLEDGEKQFNELSFKERVNFDEESIINVNNIKIHRPRSQSSCGIYNEYFVVTILVAAKGIQTLPTIKSTVHLKMALQNIGSISSDDIMAVEVSWTPQKENDTLSAMEVLNKYPLLKPLDV